MKRVLVILALSLMALTAKAQIYVGGGFAASFSSTCTASIFPEVGYNLDDNMAVGTALGIHFGNGTAFSVDPYFRYYFVELGPARFFADGHFNFTVGPKYTDANDNDYTYTSWGIGIRPGVSFDLGNNFTLITRLAQVGYYGGEFGIKLNPGFVMGLLYSF